MAAPPISCPQCRAPLPEDPGTARAIERCPACRTLLRVLVFPALTAPGRTGVAAERVVAEGEAACFYHADKKAVIPCDECGRFLCALCDLNFGGRHLCPVCLEHGTGHARLEILERTRPRHDQIVWYLLLLPLLSCGFLLPVTATLALVWTRLKWPAKPSLVANTRARLAWAIPVAILELAGGLALWIGIATHRLG